MENFTILSQSNLEQVTKSSTTLRSKNVSYVTYNTWQQFGNNTSPQQTPIPIHIVYSNIFIYWSPSDYHQYYVDCKKISNDLILQLLNKHKENILKENEHIFFYQ